LTFFVVKMCNIVQLITRRGDPCGRPLRDALYAPYVGRLYSKSGRLCSKWGRLCSKWGATVFKMGGDCVQNGGDYIQNGGDHKGRPDCIYSKITKLTIVLQPFFFYRIIGHYSFYQFPKTVRVIKLHQMRQFMHNYIILHLLWSK
jgi:hypothetical protein